MAVKLVGPFRWDIFFFHCLYLLKIQNSPDHADPVAASAACGRQRLTEDMINGMKEVIKTLKALSDPTRLRIILLLREAFL
jgi:hypothetical protein